MAVRDCIAVCLQGTRFVRRDKNDVIDVWRRIWVAYQAGDTADQKSP